MRWVLAAFLLLVLASCGDGDGADSSDEPGDEPREPMVVQANTIAKGSQGPTRAAEVVARSAEEFREAWVDHGGDALPALGNVDFGREMVVAVFQGEQPSAGYGVEITSATTAGRIRYVASRPDPETCVTAAVITAPFHVVAMPTAEGDVEFDREERTVTC